MNLKLEKMTDKEIEDQIKESKTKNQFLLEIGEIPNAVNRQKLFDYIVAKRRIDFIEDKIEFSMSKYFKKENSKKVFNVLNMSFDKRYNNNSFIDTELKFEQLIQKFTLIGILFGSGSTLTPVDRSINEEEILINFIKGFLSELYSNGNLNIYSKRSSTPEYNFAIRSGLKYPIYEHLDSIKKFNLGAAEYLELIIVDLYESKERFSFLDKIFSMSKYNKNIVLKQSLIKYYLNNEKNIDDILKDVYKRNLI